MMINDEASEFVMIEKLLSVSSTYQEEVNQLERIVSLNQTNDFYPMLIDCH